MSTSASAEGFYIQESPAIAVAALPGRWLLKHSTPSWRIKDPQKGFQRVIRESRAKEIAVAVLNQGRTFPNAIVLATNVSKVTKPNGQLHFPKTIRFLVVDGQHRLWAQTFTSFDASYACIIHFGLSVVEMARLFLEINDNQKRVPASLRWDLVRLVRPDDDPSLIEAAELVYELANERGSPLYQRIDLTGEQGEIELKQASIAPELKSIVTSKKASLKDLDFDKYYEALIRYLAAIRSVDPDGWKTGKSELMKARVLRALLRLLGDIADKEKKPANEVSTQLYANYLSKIDRTSLSTEHIRAVQGSAGMKEIYDLVKHQIGIK
jgi:DGQHR domain-containing protein